MDAFGKSNERAQHVPLSVLSDAGAWLVRLSGPLRTPAAEQGFQQWLKESALHVTAFRQVAAEWDEADRLKRFTDVEIRMPVREDARQRPMRGLPAERALLAAAAALVIAVGAGLAYYLRTPQIATGINELRVVSLDDGSRVHLNTSTTIAVAYDETQRSIRLESGEALFEVAKHPHWPFVVTAADRQVQALGTSFLVRRDASRIAVTLMEGEIAVSGATDEEVAKPMPGERLTFSATRPVPQRDHPEVNKLLAWQSGKVAIDNLPLAEAVAEMNRYSSTPLVLEQSQPGELRVSGVFIAGQSRSFARAIAQSYGLEVIDRGRSIVLSGAGRSAVK